MPHSLSEDFLAEARRWISTDTVTTRSNEAFIDRAAVLFTAAGCAVRRQVTRERGQRFVNLIARRGPAGPPLLLNTHSDTVPPGPAARWTRNGGRPFRLTRRGNRFYGLGVADVKLNLLCQWEALRRLSGEFRRPLCFTSTYGEERGLRGARRLLAGWHGPRPVLALIGEPSEGALIHRHRGYVVWTWTLPRTASSPPLGKDEVAGATAWRLRVQGKSAHSSTPHLGVSAVERLFTILRRWESRGVTFQVLKLEGGTAHNQVPAVAEAILRARGLASPGRGATLVPAASPRDASAIPWRPLADGWERFRDEWPGGFSSNLGVLEPHRSGVRAWVGLRTPAQADHRRIRPRAEALLTSAGGRVSLAIDDPALNAPRRGATLPCLRDALREAAIPFRWAEKPTCTEAGLFHAAGIPAYVWGPGRSVGNIHRPNESIEVDDLSRAVLFYERLFRSWTAS